MGDPQTRQRKAINRICRRMGQSRNWFWALPEDEQLEWLADDLYLDEQYKQIMESLKTYEDGKVILKDFGAYIRLLVERL